MLYYHETRDLSKSEMPLPNVIVRHDFTAFTNSSQREAFLLKIIALPSTHHSHWVIGRGLNVCHLY